jgi:putative ABC transport system substrate-binding protein
MYQQAARGFQQNFGSFEPSDIIYVDDPRKLDARIEQIRTNPPRLIVAIGTNAATVARTRYRDIPIIYCLALHPGQNNLVGSNVGGITLNLGAPQLFAEVERLLPKLGRIGVVYNEQVSGPVVRDAQRYLRGKVRLVTRDARTPREAAQAVEELMGQVDAFWLVWDQVVLNPTNFNLLVNLSLKNKVALIAPAPAFVEAGALMSVGPDYLKAGQRAGELARQFLEGNLREFSAEPPPQTVVTINAPVARKLGIRIPQDLVAEILSGQE